ncbi:MAG: PASTA domain-containing protein [Solirubrobacterales bacterium]
MRLRADEVVDDRYRLIERIGSGGMADVWRARDNELERDVAIKVLHENFARDKEFVERFRREASAAAGLQHPNVVSVYDRGSWEDTYYIAMELIEGSSLRDLINKGLDTGESVEVTRQVLAAAGFAHSKGIVHRDLKPMNVLIDREGRIRVTDFGIARAGDSEITQTGSVMGTAQYLSPEQAQGMDVTAAADIYAIGIMLFEMLTGRVPFEGENAVAIAMKQVAEEPPLPSSLNPEVGPALDAVVMKALAKDPAERFQTAAEMTAALDSAEADPEHGGHTQRFAAMVAEDEKKSRRKWWILAAIVLLLAAGAAAYFLTRPEMVTVPDVVNQTEAEATNELRDAGLEVGDINRVESDDEPGTVLASDPTSGDEVEKGSEVDLSVSLGPGTVEVPRVTGLQLGKAKAALKDAGFVAEVEKDASARVPKGVVISSNPSEGAQLEPGSTVTLTASTGSPRTEVPDVVGLDRVEAASKLRDAGFVVNQDSQDSDEPQDQVLSQDPAAGTEAKDGSVVNIVYSSGVGTITLGDFIGSKLTTAQSRIEGQGLDVDVIERDVTDSSQDGVVLDQAPSPGSRLSPGDTVTLTVGNYVEPDDDGGSGGTGTTTTTDEEP